MPTAIVIINVVGTDPRLYLIIETGTRHQSRNATGKLKDTRIDKATFNSRLAAGTLPSTAFYRGSYSIPPSTTSYIHIPYTPNKKVGFVKGSYGSTEEPAVAAAREVWEEVGLDLRNNLERFVKIGEIDRVNPVFDLVITEDEKRIIENFVDANKTAHLGEVFNAYFVSNNTIYDTYFQYLNPHSKSVTETFLNRASTVPVITSGISCLHCSGGRRRYRLKSKRHRSKKTKRYTRK
jgi:8-oxo-dGTP pyrophosphatase MutT (NUDIX family)